MKQWYATFPLFHNSQGTDLPVPWGDLSTMALPELQQAKNILDKAANILLIVPEKASLDAIASMIALYLALQTQQKTHIDQVSPHHVPLQLQFLPGSSQIITRPILQTDVIIDIAGPAAGTIRQEPLSGGVRIHITFPEGTEITKDNLEMSVRALPYDAVVMIGGSDLEALGQIFTAHTDFFYNTPIINIDHRADNEYFGTVNLVDITKGSVAEMAYELITYLNQEPLDASIATALYAGIVAGTNSFQKPSTTPNSFQAAAKAMEAKADREAVIRYLVKTKPLALLKILGRIYARLRHDEHARLFWSILRPIDFQESGATPDDLAAALREVTYNVSDYNAIALLREPTPGDKYELFVLLGKGLSKRRDEIQAILQATRDNGLLRVPLDGPQSLTDAENLALEKLRSIVPYN